MKMYIDESGNLGKDGRFFIITAIHFINEKRIKNIIKRHKVRRGLTEIKGQTTNFVNRQNIITKINSRNDYFVSYIILDKHNLKNKKLFEDKNILFNYLCSFLFKKHIKNLEDDISLFFDNRTVKIKSGNSLLEYLKIKAYTSWNYKGNITIDYLDSKNNHCIQMTDLISNTIYRKYRNNHDHFYKMLKIENSIKFSQDKFLK